MYCNYGACLSGFVKIAQMLVAQKAVAMTETGKAECPSHMIDEMSRVNVLYSYRQQPPSIAVVS
jgi:hypothetical protein